jgi:DNA-binding response OmpR family regulator
MRAAATVNHPSASPASPRKDRSFRILLVEDHPDTATAMRRLLEKAGHSVSVADSVRGALEVANKFKIDLLICDVGLPDGDGMNLLAQLRKRHSLQGICMSGRASEEDIAQSRTAGFAAHLAKPVDIIKLESLVRQIGSGLPVSGNP